MEKPEALVEGERAAFAEHQREILGLASGKYLAINGSAIVEMNPIALLRRAVEETTAPDSPVAVAGIIGMAIWQRVGIGPPVYTATSDFEPRPEWYFFFLFELLRIFKTPQLLIVGSVIIPTIWMVLLIGWPFIDRNPTRHPAHRQPGGGLDPGAAGGPQSGDARLSTRQRLSRRRRRVCASWRR